MRRLLAMTAMLLLTACTDSVDPFGPEPEMTAQPAAPVFAGGAYETRVKHRLPSGAELYLVGVYFGTPAGDEVLVQAGMSEGAGARLVLHQNGYRVEDGTVRFTCPLLADGRLSDDDKVLEVVLLVEGVRTPIRLERR